MKRSLPDAAFLAACRGDQPPHRPLWIMRQAGRYLPEYRAMREKHTFLELCHDPAAAAEVTLQPIRRYGMDAAILFTDLLIPVEAMGVGLRYEPGPVLDRHVDTLEAVRRLRVPDPKKDIAPMLQAATRVREALDPSKALIGFVGAPFTMACYLIEGRGSKAWDDTRRLMFAEPETFDALLARVVECLTPLVTALVEAGCDAIQVFDSWAGVLAADDFARRCAPHTDALLQAARDAGAVAITFVNGASQHLDRIAQMPADVAAVDWRMPMRKVRQRLPEDMCVQGNMDPALLFADDDTLRAAVAEICKAAGSSGHVFNLGHGIQPSTDPAKLAVLVEEVRRW